MGIAIRSAAGRVERPTPAILTTVLAFACGSPGGPGTDSSLAGPDDPIFLVRSAPAVVVMDALFEGRVEADDAGCLRLVGPDPATVVWPFGFRLVLGRVVDADGRTVGRIGERFRLGGGEVPFLPEGLGLSAGERRRVEARCPGRYWVVGDVLEGRAG